MLKQPHPKKSLMKHMLKPFPNFLLPVRSDTARTENLVNFKQQQTKMALILIWVCLLAARHLPSVLRLQNDRLPERRVTPDRPLAAVHCMVWKDSKIHIELSEAGNRQIPSNIVEKKRRSLYACKHFSHFFKITFICHWASWLVQDCVIYESRFLQRRLHIHE